MYDNDIDSIEIIGVAETPIISIMVPVYNTEKYLKRCVDSIINQTYKNLEIILVNDGSTDKSGEICDEFARRDSRVKVVHKKTEAYPQLEMKD